MNNLVLLESPNKVSCVEKILKTLYPSEKWTVKATTGHFVNLCKDGKYNCGIDFSTFTENYEILKNKNDIVKELKNLVKKSDIVYIASDADLQGEYIGWTMMKFLNIPNSKLKRARFLEITSDGIKTGIENSTVLDMNEVSAARTQRMIDRIVGFRTSASIRSEHCEAAGRVQSVVLAEIVNRDKTIDNFISEKFYELYLPFTLNKKEYLAKYRETFKSKIDLEEVLKNSKSPYSVASIKNGKKTIKAPLGFTTASLQQTAISKFGYSSSVVSKIAQTLFEGKTINGITGGLITYIRTDSTRMSSEFVDCAKDVIIEKYGKDSFYGTRENKKAPTVGGAHECIRPTHLKEWTPEIVKPFLNSQEFKIYELIYKRSIAALMPDAILETCSISILDNSKKYQYNISESKIKKPGFKEVYSDDDSELGEELFKLKLGDILKTKELTFKEKETTPPARYNESSIIKFMEANGIGRPSTYSPTIENLKKHGYINIEKRQIVSTELGQHATELMLKYFSEIMSISYTADLENKINEISIGKNTLNNTLTDFYKPFNETVLKANREIKANKPPMELLDEKCPECNAPLVKRKTKTGNEFLACSRFPKCRFTKSLEITDQPEHLNISCPECKNGFLVKRKSKKGEYFIACSEFKNGCRYTQNIKDFIKEHPDEKI